VLLVATILSLSPARSTCFAAETPLPAAPARWVTDEAGFLSAQVRTDLDARLRAFEGSSGHQVLLWIGRSTGVAPIEDWASRAFASWRVGRKGLDDGVVLFIMADDRKIRIEVGYGLEERLPDVRASAIIRETIVPRLRDGDRDGAAREGIGAILTTLGGAQSGDGSAPVEGEGVRPKLGWGELALLAVLAILLAGFLLTHPNLAILLLTTLASGRGRDRGGGGFGGFGGGGGGFSGGGGRSGGGGATGSW
jgi:uncharacterized protein